MQSLPREIFYESIYGLSYFTIVDQFLRSAVAPYPIDDDFWRWRIERKLQVFSLKEYFTTAVLDGEVRTVSLLLEEYDPQKFITLKLMRALVSRCDHGTYSKLYFDVFLRLAKYCSHDILLRRMHISVREDLFRVVGEYPDWQLVLKESGAVVSLAVANKAVIEVLRELLGEIREKDLREALLASLENPLNSTGPDLYDAIGANDLAIYHPKVACYFQQFFLIGVDTSKKNLNPLHLLDFYNCCESNTFSFDFKLEGSEVYRKWDNYVEYNRHFARNIFAIALAGNNDSTLRKVLSLRGEVTIKMNRHIRTDFLQLLIEKLPLKELDVNWAYRNDSQMFALYTVHPKTRAKAERVTANKKAKRKYKKIPRPQGQVVMSGALYEQVRIFLRREVTAGSLEELVQSAQGGRYLLIFRTTSGREGAFFLNGKAVQSARALTALNDEDVQVGDYMRNFMVDPIVSFSLLRYP